MQEERLFRWSGCAVGFAVQQEWLKREVAVHEERVCRKRGCAEGAAVY